MVEKGWRRKGQSCGRGRNKQAPLEPALAVPHSAAGGRRSKSFQSWRVLACLGESWRVLAGSAFLQKFCFRPQAFHVGCATSTGHCKAWQRVLYEYKRKNATISIQICTKYSQLGIHVRSKHLLLQQFNLKMHCRQWIKTLTSDQIRLLVSDFSLSMATGG